MADGVRRRLVDRPKEDRRASNGLPTHQDRRSDVLGFRDWFVAMVVLSAVYGAVVCLHQSLPDVKDNKDFSEFSEARARHVLRLLTSSGPRPSGSYNLEELAVKTMTNRIAETKKAADEIGKNRVEMDIQHPSGCFDLKFLSAFTLCYDNVTNVIARIGPSKGATDHSLLLNCHLDSMPDTPGATDDAVSCAIMLEILDLLARKKEPLRYDVIFLFNGAEENFLQGAHGFIESHPWRHSIRSFINLEGTGSGGREILFQSGPGNSWLLKKYLEHAPHPYCSILAQEIFQSGVIPSDTDFRIFRDFGRQSGLDIAYTRNGWIYHTEFDTEWRIAPGSIQRAGENVYAVVEAIQQGDELGQPSKSAEENKWVFYDVVGLFTVCYSVELGVLLNVAAAVATFLFVFYRLTVSRLYSFVDIFSVFGRHLAAIAGMAFTGAAIVALVNLFDLVMCWYSMPELIGLLYVLPMATAGLYVHAWFAARNTIRNAEMVHFDSVLILLAIALFLMTVVYEIASAFVLLNYLGFSLLRDPVIFLLGRLGVIRSVKPRTTLLTQLMCLIPAMVFAAYAVSQCVDFFVPVMGRTGRAVNPEFVIAPLALVIAFTFVLFTNNLVYISRRLNFAFKASFGIFVFFFIVLLTTPLGVPYKYQEEVPKLRRMIALHTQRTIHNFEGVAKSVENCMFVQTLDYRSTGDLPAHSFLQGSSAPDCSDTDDEYCRMPYYTAIYELFPPDQALWVPVPSPPNIAHRISLRALSRDVLPGNKLNITFELDGGFDKMSLHVTPINGFKLAKWSLTDTTIADLGPRKTYFVFLAHGYMPKPPTRRFNVVLQYTGEKMPDVTASPSIEMSVASHQAHGKYQLSDTLGQLRTLIETRRKTPHQAVGWWKWGITMIAGNSEISVYQF